MAIFPDGSGLAGQYQNVSSLNFTAAVDDGGDEWWQVEL